jgi:hypothetical protein
MNRPRTIREEVIMVSTPTVVKQKLEVFERLQPAFEAIFALSEDQVQREVQVPVHALDSILIRLREGQLTELGGWHMEASGWNGVH